MSKYEADKFTERAYEKELLLHKIKIPKGQTAKEVYAKYSKKLLSDPRSGVFRDFRDYGVYPARVHIISFPITIPFLVKFLSAQQVREEIVNQLSTTKERQDIKKIFGEAKASEQQLLRDYPSLGDCYTLIQLFNKRKKRVSQYNQPLLHLMIMINSLRYFNLPIQRKTLKVRKEYVPYLAVMIPTQIIKDELIAHQRRDPRHWRNMSSLAPTSKTAEHLVEDLLTENAITPLMREIMKNLRKISFRHEFYNVLERLVGTGEYFFPSVRIVLSSDRGSGQIYSDYLSEL